MDNIVAVACGLLLVVMVGVCYYGLRLAYFLRKENQKLINEVGELEENNRLLVLATWDRDETIDIACDLVEIYERFMRDDLDMLQESLYIIEENCSEGTLKNSKCFDSMCFLTERSAQMSAFLEKNKSHGSIPRCVPIPHISAK